MIKYLFVCVLGYFWGVSAEPAFAEDEVIPWKVVNGWDISVDKSLSHGCFMYLTYEGGTYLRVGFNPIHENFYFLIGDDKWASLEHGKEYPIIVQFGSREPWDVVASGFQIGDTVFLRANTGKFEFLDEMMKQTTVRLNYKGRQISHLRLDGSYAAFFEVITCQKVMNESNSFKNSDDPSNGNLGREADPFSE